MPDRDGQTCGTCVTLNPPGAPACVRCNTPLAASPPATTPAADRTLGSKPIGAGLAAPAAAAPGSSRAFAAAAQPPGYGLHTGPPPAPADDPAPEQHPAGPDTRTARRITVAGLLLVALVLLVGGGAMWLSRQPYLDAASVETAIGEELSGRGGGPVTVDCPGDPRHHGGDEFGCVATDGAGGRRTLTVTVLDDSGRYRWELDS